MVQPVDVCWLLADNMRNICGRERKMRFPRSRLYLPAAVFICILTLPAIANAQNPDLTGTWILNESSSQIPQVAVGGGGGRSGRGIGGGAVAPQVKISQDGDEITLDRRRTGAPPGRGQVRGASGQPGPQTIKVDGKPHEQETSRGPATVTAEWKEGKLVVVQELSSTNRGRSKTTMTYSLSSDGKSLTIEYEMETPGGTVEYKLVYDKEV